jgi:hypothetical protein
MEAVLSGSTPIIHGSIFGKVIAAAASSLCNYLKGGSPFRQESGSEELLHLVIRHVEAPVTLQACEG